MDQVKLASFSFVNFRITEFSFREPVVYSSGFRVNLSPSGNYNPKSGLFEIIFHAEIVNQDQEKGKNAPSPEEIVAKATIKADFQFDAGMPFEKVPEYFFQNSIAIIFPYLRSFISTLTLQANSRIIVLPLLNLTDLVGDFKRNTVVTEG